MFGGKNNIRKNRLLIPMILGLFLISGCAQDTSVEISAITETDMFGSLCGAIDTSDWSASVYNAVYFGNACWINPGRQINVRIDTVSMNGTLPIRLYNSGTGAQTFNAVINNPFLVTPDSITLLPDEFQDISLQITLSSVMPVDYYDTLKRTSTEDLIAVPAHAFFEKENTSGPVHFIFYPAFPNPSGDFMIFHYRLPSSGSMRLYITNTSGHTMLVLNESIRTAGYFSDTLKIDEEAIDPGLYRVFLEFGKIKTFGDIRID